jgi:hypothetical protein
MSNRDHKMPDRFPNESVAEITDIALTKIEKMQMQKIARIY